MQTPIVFHGKEYAGPEDMPEDVRKAVLTYMVRQVARRARAAAPPANAPLLRQLDATTSGLGTVLYTLSALMGAGLATIGIWVIVHMYAGSRSQGGAFYIGIGVVVALAWTVGSLVGLAMRRR